MPPFLLFYLFKLLLILQSWLALDMLLVQLEMLKTWPNFTLTKPIHLILVDLKFHPHPNYNSRLLLRTCHPTHTHTHTRISCPKIIS